MPKTTGYAQTVEQDVHVTSENPRAKLGEKVRTADGRIYRYAKAGATALDPGKLTVAATPVANHQNIAVAAAAAVGDTSVTVTLGATAATAGQYAEGYMVVNDADGEGIAYKVSTNAAADGSESCVVTLEDPIKVALTTSSEVSLVYNVYDNVVISAVDQADVVVGVPNVSVAANYYFWAQTGGPCAILADEVIAQGAAATIGSSTAGSVETLDAVAEPIVGHAIVAAVDTEYRAVNLCLDR